MAMGLLTEAKQQLWPVHRIVFGHFFFVPVGLRRENAGIHAFMRDVNKRRRIFPSLSKLRCGPQEISSREIRLH